MLQSLEAQKLEVRERQALLLQKDMAFDQNGDAIAIIQN